MWRFELRAELLPSGMPTLSALGFKGWGHLYSVTFMMGLTDPSHGMEGLGDQTDMAHLPPFFTFESLHVSETHQEQQTHLDQGQPSHTLCWSPTGHWADCHDMTCAYMDVPRLRHHSHHTDKHDYLAFIDEGKSPLNLHI